jgi:hypothetical protein
VKQENGIWKYKENGEWRDVPYGLGASTDDDDIVEAMRR